MTSIRIATESDLYTVFDLVLDGIKEMEDSFLDIEEDVLRDKLRASWEVEPTFIASIDGKDIGVASLTRGSMTWSSKPCITSNMVHVLREYRNFAIIKELYKTIQQYADMKKVLYIDNYFGTEKIDIKGRLCELVGLEKSGISIVYKGF
jgi:hypothetical protein